MKYPTDKIEHKLIPEYEVLFKDYKDKELTILEVGCAKGGFLMWLADYFPKAQIIGGDIIVPKGLDRLMKYSDRIKFHQIDQTNTDSFDLVISAYRSFDIIIDDASHEAIPTKNTFDVLWKYVNPGGLYIIEDFIAGYWINPKFKGMPELITELMLKKLGLGISDYGVILKELKCSYAYFKKRY